MNDTAHALSSARTLWELVERRARLTPDRPVLLQGDRSLNVGALREGSERVAAGLYDRGVRPGTVVAWQLPTRIETALLSAMAMPATPMRGRSSKTSTPPR
ncbi:AMP-binding protein, partial [Streptomyces zhihengii]